MKKLILLLFILPMAMYSQDANQNYILHKTFTEPLNEPDFDLEGNITVLNQNDSNTKRVVTYFDGLGRPIQTIKNKNSETGKDIVSHLLYDDQGRQYKSSLEYPSPASDMLYRSSIQSETQSYYSSNYGSSNAYSTNFYEPSPLNRVRKVGAPGAAWEGNPTSDADKTVKYAYSVNVSTDNVKRYSVTTGTSGSGTTLSYTISLVDNGTYAAGSLYKSTTKNENWTSGLNNTTVEFTDKEGRVILKRRYRAASSTVFFDTYYVYDNYGNLTYVIPPKVDTSISISQTVLDNLCYQYKYDYRGRMVEKKLPGKTWEFMVYDKLDRLVLQGPVLNPWGDSTQGWLMTKYEEHGRPAFTAYYTRVTPTAANRATLQSTINGLSVLSVTRAAATSVDGIQLAYTNNVLPNSNFKLLTINYYDTYGFPGAPSTLPTTVEGQNVLTSTKTLATGSWVRALTEDFETFGSTTCNIYDNYSRVIRSIKTNYLSGQTEVDYKLDFDGSVLKTITRHRRTSSDSMLTVEDNFAYSVPGRLLKHTQKIGTNEELIAKNEYDALGKLATKRVGGSDAQNGAQSLQKVDYAYNIRGWLTDINNTSVSLPATAVIQGTNPTDLFSFHINYESPANTSNGVGPQYNGNISETEWRTKTDNLIRRYGYTYDNLDRFESASYQKQIGSTVVETNNYYEGASYDKNGNIENIIRLGDSDDENNPIFIDDLYYTYAPDSNRLMKVRDDAANTSGFGDDSSTDPGDLNDDYAYDDFGNLTKDDNKRILLIYYNHLNQPVWMSKARGNAVVIVYDALGNKLKKTQQSGPTVLSTVDYLDGFQYSEYMGYAGLALDFFATPEGYVKCTPTGSGFSYNYVYNYTDHLGNVRLSYAKDPATGEVKILEENNYYAFGLKHNGYNNSQLGFVYDSSVLSIDVPLLSTYKYQYNGKELLDELGLNFYDYGARNYDPAIGRWMNIDPLADKYYNFSPYVYVGNMPTIAVDPDGKDIVLTSSVRDDGTTVINMTVTGKLINESGKAFTNEQMNSYAERLSSGIKESWGISGSDETNGKYEVNVTTNISVVSDENPLTSTDTAYRIVDPDKLPDFENGGFIPEGKSSGSAPFGQNVAYLASDIMGNTPRRDANGVTNTGRTATGDATLERTGAHETGHSANQRHPSNPMGGEKNIMHQTWAPAAGMKGNINQILQMLQDYNNGKLNGGQQR